MMPVAIMNSGQFAIMADMCTAMIEHLRRVGKSCIHDLELASGRISETSESCLGLLQNHGFICRPDPDVFVYELTKKGKDAKGFYL